METLKRIYCYCGLILGMLLVACASAVAGTTYVWTGGGVANDIDDPANWDQPAAPGSGSKIGTTDSTDIVRFDSLSATLPTAVIDGARVTTGYFLPNFELINGALNFNRCEIWTALAGGNFTIGDDDSGTLAVASFLHTTINLNRDGGPRTYIVKSDGKMSFSNNISKFSESGTKVTVVRLQGGIFDATGRSLTYGLVSLSNNYVSFEKAGSTFTAAFGGELPDAATVQAALGDSFRLGGDLATNPKSELTYADDGTNFTITANVAKEAGTVFIFR